MTTTKNRTAAGAFTAGVTRAAPPTARRNRAEAIERELATARQALADERGARERANVAANVHRMLAGTGLSATDARRVENLTETERQKCARAGQAFDLAFTVTQLVHAVRTKRGEPSTAPVNPRGEPIHATASATPPRFEARIADRARYLARLRELGLLDPAFGSIPGGESR